MCNYVKLHLRKNIIYKPSFLLYSFILCFAVFDKYLILIWRNQFCTLALVIWLFNCD